MKTYINVGSFAKIFIACKLICHTVGIFIACRFICHTIEVLTTAKNCNVCIFYFRIEIT